MKVGIEAVQTSEEKRETKKKQNPNIERKFVLLFNFILSESQSFVYSIHSNFAGLNFLARGLELVVVVVVVVVFIVFSCMERLGSATLSFRRESVQRNE